MSLVARWAAKRCLETVHTGIGGGGKSYVKRQNIPDCGWNGCEVANGSFAKISGEPWTKDLT